MSAAFSSGPLQIITADERLKERRGIKGVLTGTSGIGKTSQLWTLDPDKTLFLNLEAGELAVQGWPGDEIRIRDWDRARDLACWIGGPNPAMRDDQSYNQSPFQWCDVSGDGSSLIASGFDAWADRRRPFLIDAGGASIKVVGTRFEVNRREDATAVLVEQGRVEVKDRYAVALRVPTQVLQAGEAASVTSARLYIAFDAHRPELRPVAVGDVAAWRMGRRSMAETQREPRRPNA